MRAAALSGLLLALVGAATGCGSESDAVQALPPGSFVAATGTLDPSVHLFGDTVTARATVVVDNRKLDPDRVQLKAAFTPYKQIVATRIGRRTAGDLTELDYVYRLRCLERQCTTQAIGSAVEPDAGVPRSFRFAPGAVLYTDEGKKEPRLLRTIRWPALQSASRINGQDVTQVFGFPFRAHVVPLPDLTYRMSPVGLAAILLLLAALLLVLPVALVVRRLRRKPPPVEEPELELSPLERTLRLVEWSRGRVAPEERRAALEALAAELDAVDDRPLADDARAAGWRPPFPDPDEAGRLVLRVREAHGSAA
jgi:hypothetical protein